jgi:urease accessory protein
MPHTDADFLRLKQLGDSALPIGGVAHSFGLETLAVAGRLQPDQLGAYLDQFLGAAGLLEAILCRAAHGQHQLADPTVAEGWCDLNVELSALKPARESRAASATLGRRLLQLAQSLDPDPVFPMALQLAKRRRVDPHHCTAFGLVGGVFGLDAQHTVLAFLQQSIAGLVSAAQRLMPLGQSQAARIIWDLAPRIAAVAEQSHAFPRAEIARLAWQPGLDLASMRHQTLPTRLFVS